MLWIRSQNKEILKQVQEIDIIESDNLYHLYDSYGARTIGIYKTKARALEVLDEIQTIIMKGSTMYWIEQGKDGLSKACCDKDIVYEMPEK